MNSFDPSKGINNLKEYTTTRIEDHLKRVAGNMAQSMKDHLEENGNIDTGNLRDSIDFTTERDGNEISAYVTIDATNDNAWYAEFIEFGTGVYNEEGAGRQTPWRWQPKPGSKYYKTDENGDPVWYTTEGMEPHPFIRPAIAEHLGELEHGLRKIVQGFGEETVGNLKRYGK